MKFETLPVDPPWHLALLQSTGLPLHWQYLIVIGVMGIVLILTFRLLFRKRKGCRWKKDTLKRGEGLQRWQCMKCGVDAFSQDRRAPKECKRALREVGL